MLDERDSEQGKQEKIEIPLSAAVKCADFPECTLPRAEPLTELLGPTLGGTVSKVFGLIDIAEEEIDAAKQNDPTNAATIHQSFRYLRPTEPFRDKGDAIFRAHCREIIGRVVAGTDEREMALGTRAEVLATLVDLSLVAPLNRVATLLYGKLFTELLPEEAKNIPELKEPSDDWEAGQVAELESEFRRKLRVERAC